MVVRRYTRGPVTSSVTKPRRVPTISPVSSSNSRSAPVVPDSTPGVRTKPATPGPRFSDFQSSLGLRSSKQGARQGPSYDPTKQARDFQPYGVGKPRYGAVRSAPNVGPVTGKEGYKERDLRNRVLKARTQTLLKRRQKGQIANPRMPA